jgi:HSP20 family protein
MRTHVQQRPAAHQNQTATHHVPAANIIEQTDAWLVQIAAPGREKTDFSIQFEGGRLTIEGKAPEPTAAKKLLTEFSLQPLRRVFTVSKGVSLDQIEAHYEQGILTLRLPKSPEFEARIINIK